jgi:dynein heavy chain
LGQATDDIFELLDKTVQITVEVYNTVRETLRPTPIKSHYSFNLRDISKVFQGMCQVSLKQCQEVDQYARLWFHECMRVFHDRLINDEDRKKFIDILKTKFSTFNLKDEEILNVERILLSDFQKGIESEDNREYY